MFNSETAIVTGGAKGIGLAISQHLVRQGTKVLICSRTQSDINQALKILNSSNRKMAFGILADVSMYGDCQKLIRRAKKLFKNHVDVLVNNAGIYGPIGLLEKNDFQLWAKTIEINLLGMVYCCQLVIPFMKRQGRGKIINLCGGGVGGSTSLPRFSAYYTSKVAVAGFTEVLADELKDYNIQVNCIAPGAVNTGITDYLITQGPKKAGPVMYEKAVVQKQSGGDSPLLAVKLVGYLILLQRGHLTGRLLSAKWDDFAAFSQAEFSQNLFKLRRIDNKIFHESKP